MDTESSRFIARSAGRPSLSLSQTSQKQLRSLLGCLKGASIVSIGTNNTETHARGWSACSGHQFPQNWCQCDKSPELVQISDCDSHHSTSCALGILDNVDQTSGSVLAKLILLESFCREVCLKLEKNLQSRWT